MSDLIGAKKLNATLIVSSQRQSLSGVLSTSKNLNAQVVNTQDNETNAASVSSDKKLNATLNVSELPKMIGCLASSTILEGTIGHRVKEPLNYTGDYEVTSMIDIEQTLETAKRYLDRNITVKAIPYAEVSNLSGGRTVTIGG